MGHLQRTRTFIGICINQRNEGTCIHESYKEKDYMKRNLPYDFLNWIPHMKRGVGERMRYMDIYRRETSPINP